MPLGGLHSLTGPGPTGLYNGPAPGQVSNPTGSITNSVTAAASAAAAASSNVLQTRRPSANSQSLPTNTRSNSAGQSQESVRSQPRRVWVRKMGAKEVKEATSVFLEPYELVDDFKTRVLSKYSTSLMQTCDPADLIITLRSASNGSKQTSIELSPDEDLGSILDKYFPQTMTIADALEIGPRSHGSPSPLPSSSPSSTSLGGAPETDSVGGPATNKPALHSSSSAAQFEPSNNTVPPVPDPPTAVSQSAQVRPSLVPRPSFQATTQSGQWPQSGSNLQSAHAAQPQAGQVGQVGQVGQPAHFSQFTRPDLSRQSSSQVSIHGHGPIQMQAQTRKRASTISHGLTLGGHSLPTSPSVNPLSPSQGSSSTTSPPQGTSNVFNNIHRTSSNQVLLLPRMVNTHSSTALDSANHASSTSPDGNTNGETGDSANGSQGGHGDNNDKTSNDNDNDNDNDEEDEDEESDKEEQEQEQSGQDDDENRNGLANGSSDHNGSSYDLANASSDVVKSSHDSENGKSHHADVPRTNGSDSGQSKSLKLPKNGQHPKGSRATDDHRRNLSLDHDDHGELTLGRQSPFINSQTLLKLTGGSANSDSPAIQSLLCNTEEYKAFAGKLNYRQVAVVPQIKVLIVEDNEINQRILEVFMRRKRVRYKVAKNGRDAIEKWRQGGFHLILMDIQLPDITGLEATTEIRRLEVANGIGVFPYKSKQQQLPSPLLPEDQLSTKFFRSPVIIVALTASDDDADKNGALAAGCNDFLTKPVNHRWLEAKITEWGCMQALIDFDGWKRWFDVLPQSSSVVSTSPHDSNSGTPALVDPPHPHEPHNNHTDEHSIMAEAAAIHSSTTLVN